MTDIGSLIRALRLEKRVSIAEACKDVCTERFMYMIENNNRIPSAETIKKIGDILDVNIYNYLEYIGFKCPIVSKELVDQSRDLKAIRDFINLQKVTLKMEQSEDYFRKPMCCEIISNKVYLDLFLDKNPTNALDTIEITLLRIVNIDIDYIINKSCFINNFYYVTFFNYYFIVNRMIGEDKKAEKTINYLWGTINKYRSVKN